ncbi:MAG: SRPBCC family protein [Aestuariibacter sp.]
MGTFKKAAIALLILVVVFVGVGFILPSEFDVERHIVVNAPPEEVYQQVANLKKWRHWGVWFERDPNMKVTYSGPEMAIGMKSQWESEQEGSGEMTIIDLVENHKVVYSLYFPDFDMGSTGEITIEPLGTQTVINWRDYGDVGSNPINHYFAALMDSMIGPDFEAGLANLKSRVER